MTNPLITSLHLTDPTEIKVILDFREKEVQAKNFNKGLNRAIQEIASYMVLYYPQQEHLRNNLIMALKSCQLPEGN